jgi:GH15 family glucan-1,4-alpha-glucosidase
MMCWIALDRARRLAGRGSIPAEHAPRWDEASEAIQEFIETECWSPAKRSYVRHAGTEELDASLLLGILHGYEGSGEERLGQTVAAVRRELTRGPYVLRYSGEDGLAGAEGAFITCSFWLVEALVQQGQRDEAAGLMDQLVGLANDVGLYSEEIDPASADFAGNFPQGLCHLALISAAKAIEEADAK